MLHYIFVSATWLIGGLGITGTIVAVIATVFLGPTAVIAIIGPFISRFISCSRCVAAAVFVLSTVGAYWVGHHGEYRRGYDAAISNIAAEDAAAIGSALAKRDVWKECRAKNGTWDQTTGSCK